MDESSESVEPRSRPAGVTIISILAIFFGFVGFCCVPFSIFSIVAGRPSPYMVIPAGAGYFILLFTNVISWIFSIVSIVLGVGLWGLKEWARKGTVAYCLFQIVFGIVGTVLNLIFIAPAQAANIPPTWQFSAESYRLTVMIATPLCPSILILIHILIAVYLTRPKTKLMFAPMD